MKLTDKIILKSNCMSIWIFIKGINFRRQFKSEFTYENFPQL